MNSDLHSLLENFRQRVAADPELAEIDLLSAAVRPSVRMATKRIQDFEIGIGETRIGGSPDLPRDLEWPRWQPPQRDDKFGNSWKPGQPAPLGFVAQIDLQAMPLIDESLPRSGWLYFFMIATASRGDMIRQTGDAAESCTRIVIGRIWSGKNCRQTVIRSMLQVRVMLKSSPN